MGQPGSVKSELPPGRNADRVKPAADEDLGVRLAAEVASGGSTGDLEVPFVHGEFEVSTFNNKPMKGLGAHDTADLALEFFQRRHEGQALR